MWKIKQLLSEFAVLESLVQVTGPKTCLLGPGSPKSMEVSKFSKPVSAFWTGMSNKSLKEGTRIDFEIWESFLISHIIFPIIYSSIFSHVSLSHDATI